MGARVIKGASVAARIREQVTAEVRRSGTAATKPRLQVLLAGDDPGSHWYAASKVKLGGKLGIQVEVSTFAAAVTSAELLAALGAWNRNPAVHGILVELPLPAQIDKQEVLAAIAPHKDVDGVTPVNRGLLFGGTEERALLPATPMACLELLAEVPVELSGARAAVIGRGDTVGRPLAALLVTRHVTVTICHTRTPDLAAVTREADLVIAAAGRPGVVTGAMIRPGATVIDAGITDRDGSLVGDVEWDSVSAVAGAVTPVPGGVGTVTTAIIMRNLLRARALQQRRSGGAP